MNEGNALAVNYLHRATFLDTAGSGLLLDWSYRPLDEIRHSDVLAVDRSANLEFAAKYRVLDGLTATMRYQNRSQRTDVKDHQSLDTYFARDLINRFTQIVDGQPVYPIPKDGILNVRSTHDVSQNFRGQLDFKKTWHDDHSLRSTLVGEVGEMGGESSSGVFYGYGDRLETYHTLVDFASLYSIMYRIGGTQSRIPNPSHIQTANTRRRISILSTLTYTYGSRYTIYGSARRDGANVFGVNTNNKWKPLWSIGASWDIAREGFEPLSIFSTLRLRTSFGYMGNTIDGSGKTVIRYQNVPDAYTGFISAAVSNPPNPDLRWEQVETANIGLDFGFARIGLSGSTELFRKVSTDVIARMPIDPTSGVTTFNVNSAGLEAKGAEISLGKLLSLGQVRTHLAFGYSFTKTVVKKFYDSGQTAQDFISYGINPAVGKIAYGLSSYRWAGLHPETGAPQGTLHGETTGDYLGIGLDSVGNQIFHGSSVPLSHGFFNLALEWRGVRLSAGITYGFQYYYRRPTINYSSLVSQGTGHVDYYSRWLGPGDESNTNVPSMIYPLNATRDAFYENSELHIARADHIQLRTLRLQYNIQKPIQTGQTSIGVQAFLFANNLNLYLWRYDDSPYNTDLSYSPAYGDFPALRSINFGLNLIF